MQQRSHLDKSAAAEQIQIFFADFELEQGSIIAAAALTILPEALRQFASYRMLVYAIVLILVMLIRNNPSIQAFFARFRVLLHSDKKGGAA